MSIKGLLLPWAAALLIALAAPATAHRGHAVWTDITWTGETFEITHRLHLADAVTVLRSLGSREEVETPRALARLALYVEERFAIQGLADPAAPSTLGAEVEDDFLFVYQEWSSALPERFPAIDNAVLLDVEPRAQHFIRIRGPGIDEERQSIGGLADRDSPTHS